MLTPLDIGVFPSATHYFAARNYLAAYFMYGLLARPL